MKKILEMEEKSEWEEEIEYILSERMGQVYRKIMQNEKIRKIREEEENKDKKLEKYLNLNNAFEIYCEYEEIRGEYLTELLKEYYKQGFKDGVKTILNNMN